jgi:replicative DNA helicase
MPAKTGLSESLPQNLEAERSILGAILLDNASLDAVASRLKPQDFFHEHHRRIYQSMVQMTMGEVRLPIDLVSLTDVLHATGELQSSGGPGYIAQLMDGVPHVSNVGHYCRIVKEKAVLRELIHATHAVQQQALAGEDESADIIERAELYLAQIAEGRSTAQLAPLKDVIGDNFTQMERYLTAERGISGLASGYPQLDGILCGLQPGNVIVLAARPSIGKTALALNIAENVARRQQATAFFSLEMTRVEILQRLLASAARRDLKKLRAGGMARQDWAALTVSLAEMGQWPLYIDDANPTTVTEIGAKARYLDRRTRLALIVVDYLQLVSASRAKFSNRNEEVGASSRALKSLARTLNLPVLVLSQLTRASEREERRPQLSDLRESGAIEQDADVVLFIHRPKAFAVSEPASERCKTELIVAKQRNGPTEVAHFAFLAPFTRFEEMTPELFQGEN